MISVTKKEECVGCNACVQCCLHSCISMNEDEQGFLYPKVDLEKCIDCHLCEKVCPVINQREERKPLYTYAAKNKNPEIQKTSSSGGVFFALVEHVIIEKKGVVFGARFNEKWEIIHDYAETLEGAKAFKGSKYVQSRIGNSYKKADEFLKAGRTVLFSGTPCQIAALKLYLRKDWGSQLIAVDVVCHGVPSPLVWLDYLEYIKKFRRNANGGSKSYLKRDNTYQIEISFRDKKISWEKFGFSINATFKNDSDQQYSNPQYDQEEVFFETADKNLFMQGFLKDLYLRPSCYSCPSKCGKSHSDITLADFWGIKRINQQFYSDEGVSLVLCYSDNELITINNSLELQDVDYLQALFRNPAICKSVKLPQENLLFWNKYSESGIALIKDIVAQMTPGIIKIQFLRTYRYFKRQLHMIFK